MIPVDQRKTSLQWELEVYGREHPYWLDFPGGVNLLSQDRVGIRDGFGLVYLARTINGTKIGYTTTNVSDRISAARRNYGEVNDALFIGVPRAFWGERALLSEFQWAKIAFGRKKELFLLGPAQIEWVKSLRKINGEPCVQFGDSEVAQAWLLALTNRVPG